MAKDKTVATSTVDMPKIQMPQGSPEVITRPGAADLDKPADKLAKKITKKSAKKPAQNSTEASVKSNDNTAANAKPARKRRGHAARMRINMAASALTLFWLGGMTAFSYGFYSDGSVNISSLPPTLWAGLFVALLVPVGLVWIGATILSRLLDLNETSLRLATVSRELTDPGTTAANDVSKLGATIRKELDGLNREIDNAVSRVSELESRLKQHTTMINETAKRVDTRTSNIAARLSEEREKVDAVTRTLSSEAKLIGETLDMQSHAINKAASEATDFLREAEDGLNLRTEGLGKAAEEAAETTKNLAEDIERETGKLETISASARSRAEVITTRYSEQHKAMSEVLAQHGEQQTKLQAALEQQQGLVSNMAETVSRQVQKIEESVSDAADGFTTAIDGARDKAADAGMSFEDRAKTIADTAEAAADRLGAAADAVTLLSREAQQDLENQAKSSDKILVQQAADAHQLLKKQIAEVQELFDAQADHARGELTGQAGLMRDELERQTAAAEARLGQQAQAAQAGLNQQSKTALTRLSDQSETALSRLDDHADVAERKLVEQDATSRALLESQAKDTAALITDQATSLSQTLEDSLNHLRGRLSELTEKGSAAMIGRADELDEALRAGEESMRTLSERLDASIKGVSEGSEDVGRLFAETADAFEARMAQFPAHADDAVSKVRNQISAQIEALAKLADVAASKAHELTHAIENQSATPADLEDDIQETLFEDNRPPLGREMPKSGFNLRTGPGMVQAPADNASGDEESAVERRSRLGESLTRNMVSRLNTDDVVEETPAGIRAAESTGVLRAEEMEDISDFTVKPAEEAKSASQERGEHLNAEERPAPTAPTAPKGWRSILSSMDKREEDRSSRRGDDTNFQTDALLIIEKLQAMSIDLDRALEDAPSTELLDRYMSGERNVFARRLATFTGPDMLERIARTYREDAEFRTVVNRYIEGFEGLLRAARGRDRENILVETYLTSQTGKVYMILGTATGHLK